MAHNALALVEGVKLAMPTAELRHSAVGSQVSKRSEGGRAGAALVRQRGNWRSRVTQWLCAHDPQQASPGVVQLLRCLKTPYLGFCAGTTQFTCHSWEEPRRRDWVSRPQSWTITHFLLLHSPCQPWTSRMPVPYSSPPRHLSRAPCPILQVTWQTGWLLQTITIVFIVGTLKQVACFSRSMSEKIDRYKDRQSS